MLLWARNGTRTLRSHYYAVQRSEIAPLLPAGEIDHRSNGRRLRTTKTVEILSEFC